MARAAAALLFLLPVLPANAAAQDESGAVRERTEGTMRIYERTRTVEQDPERVLVNAWMKPIKERYREQVQAGLAGLDAASLRWGTRYKAVLTLHIPSAGGPVRAELKESSGVQAFDAVLLSTWAAVGDVEAPPAHMPRVDGHVRIDRFEFSILMGIGINQGTLSATDGPLVPNPGAAKTGKLWRRR